MDVGEFPWLWVPGALILVSLILYGVDAVWMTPLYIAEMLMFSILGAERSDYGKGKPLAALYAVLLWIAGQVMLWLNWDAMLLWAVVLLQLALAYVYWFTDKLRVTVRQRKRGYTDYSSLAMLLLIFFTVARLAISADLYQVLWAGGIFIIAVADFFLEDIATSNLRLFRKYSWVGYLAPIGALISAYAAIAVATPGLPLAII